MREVVLENEAPEFQIPEAVCWVMERSQGWRWKDPRGDHGR